MQFYCSVYGRGQTPVTKGGDKETGITAHVRGWNVGARVRVDHVNGKDVVRVYSTKGSNDESNERLIATIFEGEAPVLRVGDGD